MAFRSHWTTLGIVLLGCSSVTPASTDGGHRPADAGIPDARGEPADASSPDAARTDPRFETLAAALEADLVASATPGAAVAIVLDGRLRFTRGVGHRQRGIDSPVSPDTPFLVGSIGKPLTAALAALLVEDGTIDLDEPITTYVPWLRFAGEYGPESLNLGLILSHRSGYPNFYGFDVFRTCPPLGREGYVQAFRDAADQDLWFPPDTLWNYSNSGYALAGLVLQEAENLYFPELMEARLFGPASMTGATFDANEAARRDPAFGHDPSTVYPPMASDCGFDHPQSTTLWANATDLARFAEALLRPGEILSERSIEALTTAHSERTEGPAGYGYGMYIDEYKGLTVWHHSGSVAGYQALVWMIPERGFAAVFLANGPYATSPMAWHATDLFLELPPGAPPFEPPRPIGEWGRYPGAHRDAHGELGNVDVALEDERLFATGSVLGERVELQPLGRDLFVPRTGPWANILLAQFVGVGDALYLSTRFGVARKLD